MSGSTQGNNRFENFANFFKGYMSVSAIVAATLPIAFKQLGVIPGFEVHKQFLPIYTSLFCFLILAFCFYLRYRLAWWMFHNELNGRSVGFARPIKTVFRFIPFLLIVICFACIIWYHNLLDQSIVTIQNELIFKNPDNNQVSINPESSVSYFGIPLNYPSLTNIEDFKANQGQLNSNFILEYADPSAIDNSKNSQLIIYYLGIFIAAQTAFILMALREYLQDVLEDSGLFKNANEKQLNNQICGDIKNQDSSEICYFFLEQNAKIERNDAQYNILKILKKENKKASTEVENDKKTKRFDKSNYKQNIINDILENPKFNEDKSITDESMKELLRYLQQLKQAFESLHKWEKVEKIMSISNQLSNQLNKKQYPQLFKHLQSFSEDVYEQKDYYSSLKSCQQEKETKTKDNLEKVIEGLLKYNYRTTGTTPQEDSDELIKLIEEHRQNLKDDFQTSPSLKEYCAKIYDEVFQKIKKENPHISITTELSLENTLQKSYYEFSSP